MLVVKKKNIKTISDGPGKPRQQDRHTMLATLKLHVCTMATPTSMTCVSFLSYQGLHVHNIALAEMTQSVGVTTGQHIHNMKVAEIRMLR